MVICLGELVVDFISLEPGRPLWAVERFEKHVGGSPANVAVGLHHHGVPVRLWSKIGTDSLGRFALERIRASGVPLEDVVQDARYPTRFLFIGVDEQGQGVIEVHNRQSADQHLRPDELPLDVLAHTRWLHVGGTTLLGEVTAETTRQVVETARRHGCRISLDPNVRPGRTSAADLVRRRFAALLPFVDVLKMSVADWPAVWGDRTPTDVLDAGCALVVLTDGAQGARLLTRRFDVHVPAPPVHPVDTTGAGDAFTAVLLARLVACPPGRAVADVTEDELRAWGSEAAAWAGRVLEHRGAVTAYTATAPPRLS